MSSHPLTTQTDGALKGLPRRDRWIPSISPAAIASLALVIAVVTGRFLADGRTKLGMALVLGVCYGPLAFLDLTAALAVYVAILYVQDVSALSVGPNTVGVLVLLGWAGTFITRSARPAVLREQSRLLFAITLFALWLTLSIMWAESPGDAAVGLKTWLIAIIAFFVVFTTLRRPRDVALIAVAFIVGSVVSVALGAVTGALSATATSANETVLQGRFTGGGGDPNVQAAGFIVAMFLCVGLLSIVRGFARLGLMLALIVVATGFFATQSRGGLVALTVAAVAGLVVLPRQRKRLLGLVVVAGIGIAIVAVMKSNAITRMTDFSGGSSGRTDLWAVAWNIFAGHPWAGIGLRNFQYIEPHYALNSGPLTHVDLIAERPHLVHNLYLQLLAETGVVGLLLFLVIVAGCLRASWLAARYFDATDHIGYGDLARAVLMATIGMLAAEFFISDGDDWRLWILLGLGPVLLSLARRAAPLNASSQIGVSGSVGLLSDAN